MKFLSRLSLPLLIIILFASCKSQQAYSYLQDYSDTSGKAQVVFQEPLIQKNDLLAINIFSEAIDGGITDAYYNIATTPGNGVQGLLVDNEGYIMHHRLGSIKAEGLTKSQLGEEIRKKIEGKLTNPTVVVRLLNFKITLLGEVARPGAVTLPSEKITILEAIGLAGDITTYGKKDEVVVLREVDGAVEHGKVDLSSKSLFESPYYFLRQNDVVLINPNKNKARLSDQVFNQRLSIAFGLINTIALLYNVFR